MVSVWQVENFWWVVGDLGGLGCLGYGVGGLGSDLAPWAFEKISMKYACGWAPRL